MLLFKKFVFDSAHFLPMVADDHKCKRIHGHTYHLTIYLEGELHPELNWVIDFAEVGRVIDPVIKRIDHRLMNEIEGLENPTCEAIAIWIWKQIKPSLPQLVKVELNETPTSGVVYTG
ncbi:MAG TPA: 6-carboxytetrahydropterin synthase QueD [Bacteroidia bacterium]|nr:6-carboxytetrahydropterin synthase QueD [Bacteroidia bacterium]HNT79773.1 6-carboxytetrahydropterin synthase QueD [Bacteroidia bacterium]